MPETDVLPPIEKSGLLAGLTKVAQINSGGPARIQQYIQSGDGSDKFYAVDTRGVVWVVENGQVSSTPFFDARTIPNFTIISQENGLRSIAFHPDCFNPGTAGYGKFYAVYTVSASSDDGNTKLFTMPLTPAGPTVLYKDVLAEFTISDPSNPTSVDMSSGRELFRIEEVSTTHNLGQILFNPNAKPGDADYGKMYVGVGEGGPVRNLNDPLDTAQTPGQIQGKVLRIDPLAQQNGDAYGVPSDNPFVDKAGYLPEIYALGFRNPQSISIDKTGLMFLGDIGDTLIEEINVVLAGGNYGWRQREGTFVHNKDNPLPLPPNDGDFGYQYPISQYDHQEIADNNPFGITRAAVSGGFVYRGTAVPELYGQYVFTDFPTGRIFHIPVEQVLQVIADGKIEASEYIQPQELTLYLNGSVVTMQQIAGNTNGRPDTRFGFGADGEVYLTSKTTGDIYKFTLSGSTVTGTDSAETLNGKALSDIIYGKDGSDLIRAQAGNDLAFGDGGNDSMYGALGNDTLNGGDGDDVLYGGVGNDKLFGDAGTDELFGGDGDDILFGGSGADTLNGGNGNDQLFGGDSADKLVGGNGNDFLSGDDGNDVLNGGAGNDRLFGGAGNDKLFAGIGNDTLDGGAGKDTLVGNAGADRFILAFAEANGDRVNDFNAADGDRIEVRVAAGTTVALQSPGVFVMSDGVSSVTFTAIGATLADIDTIFV
jgi:hypothetical protein